MLYQPAGGALSDYAASGGTVASVTSPKKDDGAVVDASFTSGTDAQGNTIITQWTGIVRFPVPDGNSQTLMFGEKHIRPASLRGKNEDRSVFGGNNNATRRCAGIDADNGQSYPLAIPSLVSTANPFNANQVFGSPHSGICHFVFCDGSVHPLNVTIDLPTLTALATRAGNEVITTEY